MDTVVIKIFNPTILQLKNPHWFLPELALRRRLYSELSATEKQSMHFYLKRYIFSPPNLGRYIPKMEVYEKLDKKAEAVRYELKIEFSVPKLLFGDSLREIADTDFDRVLHVLKKVLSDVGIALDYKTLAGATVCAVHICKNILLPEDIKMCNILSDLKRVDISKALDVTRVEDKQGGQVLHLFSKTKEYAFYEKVKDALRPKAKRKYKEPVGRERGVIDQYHLHSKEMFRFEFRLKKGQTVAGLVNTMLKREKNTKVTFKDLFAPGLCKALLQNSWKGLIARPDNQLALLGHKDSLSLFTHILGESVKRGTSAHSMNTALISYGLARAITDHGAKEVKRQILVIWNTDHSERVSAKIQRAASLVSDLSYTDNVAFIDREIDKYIPITDSTLKMSYNNSNGDVDA